jgi:cell division initiation protein
MKLTPLDIRHREFRRAMRGYADEEVDVFLDQVADEFERLYRENIEADERIERLEEQVAQFDQLKDTLQKTLVTAQQQSDEMRANARKEAELILRDAEIKGRDIVADSYTEKQRIQQALLQLRRIEEDFRVKFRSLLEAHLNLLVEDESSDDRRRFRGVVSGVEEELARVAYDGAPDDAVATAAQAEDQAGVPAAAPATPAGSGEPEAAPEVFNPVDEAYVMESTERVELAFTPEYSPPVPVAEPIPQQAGDGDLPSEPPAGEEQTEQAKPKRRRFFGHKNEEQPEGQDFLDEKGSRDFEW